MPAKVASGLQQIMFAVMIVLGVILIIVGFSHTGTVF
jgi:hypothetical protein